MIWQGIQTFVSTLSSLAAKITGTAGAGYVDFPEQSIAPTAADSGAKKLYIDTAGLAKAVDSSGTVSPLNGSRTPDTFASHTGTALVTASTGSLPPSVMGEFQLFTGVGATERFEFEVVQGGDGVSRPMVDLPSNTNATWDANYVWIFAFAVYNGKLYAGNGGGSSSYPGIVYSYDGTSWANANIASGSGWSVNNLYVSSLVTYGGKLYAGTSRGSANGGSQIWSYNGTTWTNVTPGWTINNTTAASMCVYGGNLYVGTGCVSAQGGGEVWSYNGTTWTNTNLQLAPGWSTNNNYIYCMAIFNGNLYVGTISGSGASQVWVYNGATWANANIGWSANDVQCNSLAVYGGKLYAGSANTTSGASIYVTSNGSTWTAVSPAPGWGTANFQALSMAVCNGKLFVGTSNVGAQGAHVFTFDGSTWVDTNVVWASTQQYAYCMCVYHGTVYIGQSPLSGGAQVWSYSSYLPQMYVNGTNMYVNWNEGDCYPDYWRVRRISS